VITICLTTIHCSQEGHTPLFKAALQGDEITHELSLALLVAAGSKCTWHEHKGSASSPGDSHHEHHIKDHPDLPKGLWDLAHLQELEDHRKAMDVTIKQKKDAVAKAYRNRLEGSSAINSAARKKELDDAREAKKGAAEEARRLEMGN